MDHETRKAFWNALADSPFLMVHLARADAPSQPMTAMLDEDAHGTIWFFMQRANALAAGGPARAELSAKGHQLFASLSGVLVEETDRAAFEKLWSDQVAAWFEGGINNPSVLLMRLNIDNADVWQVDMTIGGLAHLFSGSPIQPQQAGHHATGPV